MNLVPCIVEILTVALLASTKTTTATTTTSTRQACANGQFNLHCEAIKDVNAVKDVQWRIKSGTRWIMFSNCIYKSGWRCETKRSMLAEGINLVNNSNGAVTIERSAGKNTYDHARILCLVHYLDYSVSSHVYEINFTAHCVSIQKGRDLNLTSILLNLRLPCERVVEIDWLDINGSKFAYCNTCQTCTTRDDKSHPRPFFWNRLRVTRGSLILTGIQENDNGSEIRVQVHTNMNEFHQYTVRIFVTSGHNSPEPNTTPASTLILPTSRTNIGTARFRVPSSKHSYPDDIVYTPSTTAKLHSGSPTRNGASATAASAASAARGELWTSVVIGVAVFLFICLR